MVVPLWLVGGGCVDSRVSVEHLPDEVIVEIGGCVPRLRGGFAAGAHANGLDGEEGVTFLLDTPDADRAAACLEKLSDRDFDGAVVWGVRPGTADASVPGKGWLAIVAKESVFSKGQDRAKLVDEMEALQASEESVKVNVSIYPPPDSVPRDIVRLDAKLEPADDQ